MDDSGWAVSDHAFEYGRSLLRGPTVHLRAVTDDDLGLVATWWNDPAWSALQHNTVKPRPDEPVIEMFREWSTNKPVGADAGFSVALNETGEFVGHAALFGATLPTRLGTFAILIGPGHVGRGTGSEAARLMLGYAFRELGLNKVELRAWSYNTRALRAYEKAGFVVEGRRRAAAFHDGRWHDEIIMGVLADEFGA